MTLLDERAAARAERLPERKERQRRNAPAAGRVRRRATKEAGAARIAKPAEKAAAAQRALRKDVLPRPIRKGRRPMGRVRLVVDEGQTTDVLGICYGIEHEVSAPGYRVKVFLDYYTRRLKVMSYRASDYGAMLAKLKFLADANRFDK